MRCLTHPAAAATSSCLLALVTTDSIAENIKVNARMTHTGTELVKIIPVSESL